MTDSMTQTKTYTVRGAQAIITVSVKIRQIQINTMLDTSALDAGEPDHSDHNLIKYVQELILGNSRQSCWWCKYYLPERRVRTGAQANRVIRHTLAKLDDVVQQALINRDARKAHMAAVFPS